MKVALLLALVVGAYAAQLQVQSVDTPMSQVAGLLIQMRARIESDGKTEQMDYDRYACWCEATTKRKAKDISDGKEKGEQLQRWITELGGELGSHGAEIKQLEEDIAASLEAMREATAVREKQNAGYEVEKTESEQCIGALEQAIKVLTGAGTGGFLETMKEVQLMSAASGVRGALQNPSITGSMSSSDLTLVQQFVERPADFVGKRSASAMSAVQVANNPFGDYAPQSTQIQGILRGMYEAFTRDLESDNAAEANSQKAFEELMRTKKEELQTLEATLASQKRDDAKKSLKRANDREDLDDTNRQLAADEKFFDATKAGCKEKAHQWSIRSGLRSQELAGVNMAINILTSDQAVHTFAKSQTTFLQLGAVTQSESKARLAARAGLASLAQKYHSMSLAKLVLQVQSGGHFDRVIASIDQMIAALRKEEQEDIDQRDRCERAQGKNSQDMEDLNAGINKDTETIERLQETERDLVNKISAVEGELAETKKQMKQALHMRNEEVAHFKQAVKDDYAAVALLDQTIVALSEFYRKNRIPMSFAQGGPEYSEDRDRAPREETKWSDEQGQYGGRSAETNGIVQILSMLKEDVEKEIKTSGEDDAAAEAQYEKEKADMQDALDAQRATKVSTEKELGEVQADMQDKTKSKMAQEEDLRGETSLKSNLNSDCAWVAHHFESRRTKRKAEIDGLIDGKGYLAGAEDGSLI